MTATSLMYWNDQMLKAAPRTLKLVYDITGAAASTITPASTVSLTTYAAFASQAVIDDFLGTTNEFLLAAFDATSMGADAFGGLVNMNGQVQTLISMTAKCYSGTGGATLVERSVLASSALTASTLATEAAKGADGNLGFKVDFGNTPDFDALTSGLIVIEFDYISK